MIVSLSALVLARAVSVSSSRSSLSGSQARIAASCSRPVVGQVRAGVLDLLGGVEQGAVVDAHGVGVLVLDDGAVHERAEVAQRLVVQVGAGDALGDRLGEVRGDLVHVGEAVCHRDRELVAGRALGDAFADRLGEGELAAQVVRALGGDAEVGAHREDAVAFAQAGAGVPAVGELLLLVCERELLALVGLGLDASDLVGSGAWSSSSTIRLRTGRRGLRYSVPARSWLALAAR